MPAIEPWSIIRNAGFDLITLWCAYKAQTAVKLRRISWGDYVFFLQFGRQRHGIGCHFPAKGSG
jgi:hypothetical protein